MHVQFLAAILLLASAQDLSWRFQTGTSGNDQATCVWTDAAGQIYVVGESFGALHGNANAGQYDIFIMQLDSSGSYQRSFMKGGSASEFVTACYVDVSGIILTGHTYSGLDGFSNSGSADIYAMKIDATDLAWQWTFQTGSSSNDVPRAVQVDSSGNIILAGETMGGLGGNSNAGSGWDIFCIKLDSSQVVQWTYQTGTSSNDEVGGLQLDSAGSIYLAGDTQQGLHGLTSYGGYDMFIIKLDSGGSRDWTAQTGGSGNEVVHGFHLDASGNLVVAGYTDAQLHGNSHAGARDIFVMKLDSSVAWQWTFQTGSSAHDVVRDMQVDSSGNVLLAGETYGALDGSNAGFSTRDIFAMKLDSSGSRQWTFQTGSSSEDEARGLGIHNGEILLTGRTKGSLDGANSGAYDIFVMGPARPTTTTSSATSTTGTASSSSITASITTSTSTSTSTSTTASTRSMTTSSTSDTRTTSTASQSTSTTSRTSTSSTLTATSQTSSFTNSQTVSTTSTSSRSSSKTSSTWMSVTSTSQAISTITATTNLGTATSSDTSTAPAPGIEATATWTLTYTTYTTTTSTSTTSTTLIWSRPPSLPTGEGEIEAGGVVVASILVSLALCLLACSGCSLFHKRWRSAKTTEDSPARSKDTCLQPTEEGQIDMEMLQEDLPADMQQQISLQDGQESAWIKDTGLLPTEEVQIDMEMLREDLPGDMQQQISPQDGQESAWIKDTGLLPTEEVQIDVEMLEEDLPGDMQQQIYLQDGQQSAWIKDTGSQQTEEVQIGMEMLREDLSGDMQEQISLQDEQEIVGIINSKFQISAATTDKDREHKEVTMRALTSVVHIGQLEASEKPKDGSGFRPGWDCCAQRTMDPDACPEPSELVQEGDRTIDFEVARFVDAFALPEIQSI